MDEKRNKKLLIIKTAATVLLGVGFFGYFLGLTLNFSLNDPDLWWHLRTGEYIIENWEVPADDPFAYTTPRPLSGDNKLGLRAQWLGQVIFYFFYSIGDLLGVGVLRSILVVLPMAALYIWLVRKKLNPFLSLAIVGLPMLFLSIELFYSFERPQGISFFLALATIMLLERLKERSAQEGLDSSFFLLPAVMALWSNIHAGFIVGNVIIMIYFGVGALSAAYHFIRKRNGPRAAFFIVCAAAVAATMLNPNGYKLFIPYLHGLSSMFFQKVSQLASPTEEGGWVESVVLEYKPLMYFYRELGYTWLLYYWVFSATLYAAMFLKYILRRKFDLAELLVVSFAVLFANFYARGLMFSLTILPFYFGKTVVELKLPQLRFKAALSAAVAALLVITMMFTNYAYKLMPSSFRPGVTSEWVTPWYPTRLVEFLKATKIPGPMYNFYTWGGFLIWSLYPDYQVFIDGRAIDDMVNRTADSILKAYHGWNSELDAYNINFIVVPVVFRESGHIIPIAVELTRGDAWKLVFIRNNSAIFVRNVPRNNDTISKYSIDKKRVFQEIIDVENIFLSSMPYSAIHSLAKADALFALERYDEAAAIYERFPTMAAGQLEALKSMGRR